MTLLLAAVMYSPNIGDGVIADCVRAAAPEPDRIRKLDLSGRTDYASEGGTARQRILALLNALPPAAARPLSQLLISAQIHRSLAPLLPTKFNGAEALLIGGGQLLADATMNFPLKIHRVVTEAEARGLPIAIHSVGVSDQWSPPARRLFAKALGSPNLRFLSVRDAQSKANLMAHLSQMDLRDTPAPQVYPDPGLLAAEALLGGAPTAQLRRPGHVGLCITHPTALALHGNLTSTVSWAAWYARTARALAAAGYEISLFTNGAFEDEAYLTQVAHMLPDLGPQLHRAPRPRQPADLVQTIAGFAHVVAHRLHASIVAYSCGTLPVGLRWDRKLEGFFDLIGHPNQLLPDLQPAPEAILARLEGPPIDVAHHANLLAQARAGVTAAIRAVDPDR